MPRDRKLNLILNCTLGLCHVAVVHGDDGIHNEDVLLVDDSSRIESNEAGDFGVQNDDGMLVLQLPPNLVDENEFLQPRLALAANGDLSVRLRERKARVAAMR